MRQNHSKVRQYGAAAAFTVAVVVIKLLLDEVVREQGPFLLMPLAVLGVAWIAGRGPALFATVLGTLFIGYFFIGSIGSAFAEPDNILQLLVFIAEGVIIAFLGASRKEALADILRREQLLGVTLSSIGDAVIATDVDGRITFLNPVAEQLTGWNKEEAGSRPLAEVFRIINEQSRQPVPSPVEEVIRRRTALGLANHTVLITRDGHETPIEDSAAPIIDDEGELLGVILVFHDVSARRRAEIDREFQMRATEQLSSSLDYEKTLAQVARLAVPEIGDWCAVDMLDESGTGLKRVAVAHVDPEKVKWAIELQKRTVVDMNAPTGVPNVIRTGRSEFYPLITDEMLVAGARDEDELRLLREIGFTSLVVVPLTTNGRPVGAITLVTTDSGRHYTDVDLRLAEDLARRASTAIENATLHREIFGQREWFRVTLSSIGDAVIVTDTSGLVTFMNPIAEQLTGWDLQEASGRELKHVFHIVNEETGAEVDNPVARVLREGVIVGLANHTVLISRDGRHIPIEDSAAPIVGAEGELIGVVMVFHDVTEQRGAEYAMRESETRFRMLADSAPVLVWMSDVTGACVYVNRRWIEFTGRAVEDELGDGWTERIHRDDIERFWTTYRNGFAAKREFKMEYRRLRADGVYRWMLNNGTPRFNPDGSFAGFIGSCMDITDRMEIETDLRHAKEEAESANRAKDQFLAVLSHELRTPLTPVLAMVQSMESDNRLPRDLRGFFEIIRRNVELEARLIDDLLDLTRITKGKLQLNLEHVDVHTLIRNVLEIIRTDVQGKGIVLRTSLAAPRHVVHADSARLQQVLWNLLKNAVKFTDESGTITVSTTNHDDRLVVSVNDTGIGIEPDVLPRIFDAFEQGEQTITRHFGGLGLGLAISKALVDAHHGVLSAASEGRGKGATFSVDLPAEQEERTVSDVSDDGTSGEVRTSGPARILIVDDHYDTVTVTRMLLERAGYEILTAHSVDEALTVAAEHPFDLLISDIGLPDGSGVDLMRRLSEQYPIRGIAISGFGMEEDINRSRDAGFAEHLTKPMNFQALQDAIRRILEEK